MNTRKDLIERGKDAILNATEMWYKESLDFDYNNPGIGGLTRNFTQMVWKDSTKLGLGVARTDSRYDFHGSKSLFMIIQNFGRCTIFKCRKPYQIR